MKRNQLFLIFITTLLLLIVPVTLCIWGFLLPAQYEDSFLGELKYKCQRLDEIEGKRIVIVGGSSVAFGVSSPLLEEAFSDYQVVNLGMYAALGTTVMLDLSMDSLREGDIVILAPEQQAQTLSCYFDGNMLWQGFDGSFFLLSKINRDNLGNLIGTFPAFAAHKFSYVLSGEKPNIDGVYSKNSFNEYGDIVYADCNHNIMPNGYDSNTPISFQNTLLSEDFVEYLNHYIDTLTKRGVTIWYHFCPMNMLAVEDGADIDAYYDYLQSQLHCYVIGTPSDSILDAEWFYDSNFHLNSSGKIVYTRQIIRDIKAMLGDSSPTKIVLPPKPDLAVTALAKGDNSDELYFIYETTKDGVELAGLTEEGKKQTNLTIPVSHNGMPLTKLNASVFADNTVIQSITIQENITLIENNAFWGCINLSQIKLTGTEPEKCLVGQQLLNGTQAKIYVTEAVLSTYRLNYSWSQYADKICSLEEDREVIP